MLIELPNGEHVDPTTVSGIRPYPACEGHDGQECPPCVRVHWGRRGDPMISVLRCGTHEDARTLARDLAGRVNGAKST